MIPIIRLALDRASNDSCCENGNGEAKFREAVVCFAPAVSRQIIMLAAIDCVGTSQMEATASP